jgi:hypothetical protein
MVGVSYMSILSQFAFVVPPVIAYIIGLVLAVQRKRNHPFSAMLAMWGFLILLVETLFFACIQTVFIMDRGNSGMPMSSYGLLFGAIGILRTIFFTLGLGLLIGAIFADRGPQPMTRRRDEPDDFDAPPRPRPSASPPTDQPDTFREKRD